MFGKNPKISAESPKKKDGGAHEFLKTGNGYVEIPKISSNFEIFRQNVEKFGENTKIFTKNTKKYQTFHQKPEIFPQKPLLFHQKPLLSLQMPLILSINANC